MDRPIEVVELISGIDQLNRTYLADLLDLVSQGGTYTPFIGSGLSQPFGYPGWADFLRQLSRDLPVADAVTTLAERGEFEEAAEAIELELGRPSFNEAIRAAFDPRFVERTKVSGTAVEAVARHCAGAILTTNFDRVLEIAARHVGRPFSEVVLGADADREVLTRALQRHERLLLKLHGDVESPNQRVLTIDEYDRAYGSVKPEEVDLSRPLPAVLSRLTMLRPILFLGCSLVKDRTVDVLAALARGQVTGFDHFALLPLPRDAAERVRRRSRLLENQIRAIWYPDGRHDLVAAIVHLLAPAAAKRHRKRRTSSIVVPGTPNEERVPASPLAEALDLLQSATTSSEERSDLVGGVAESRGVDVASRGSQLHAGAGDSLDGEPTDARLVDLLLDLRHHELLNVVKATGLWSEGDRATGFDAFLLYFDRALKTGRLDQFRDAVEQQHAGRVRLGAVDPPPDAH